MNLGRAFVFALQALFRNKLRSLLTTLGVVIGVGSVVSMVAVGEGARARVERIFAAMGTSTLIVLSGTTRMGGMMGGLGTMPTLTWDDLEAIRTQAPAVRAAAPALMSRVTLVSDTANWTAPVTGTSPEFFQIRSWNVARGSTFTEEEANANAKLIVLGQTTATQLFGPSVDPVGRVVRVHSTPFQVIGLLERKGRSPMGSDFDDTAIVPVGTFQTAIQGGLQKYIAGAIAVSATSPSETSRAQRQIESILRERHNIGPEAEDDFSVRDLTEIASAQQQGTQALTLLLAAIAVVSLVVGGIGIMNIMLVSVTERTREIGLRMAVGAKPWHVLAQFVVEAMTLSMVGGVLGVALGLIAARLIADRFGWPFAARLDMAAVAFCFSALVGVAFGLYPAHKASRLNPIDALRYE
jgi:putative ABC transport system permease protein